MVSSNSSRPRMAREKRTIEVMVGMYCANYHKTEGGLCEKCIGLMDYARMRLDKCLFGEKKPSCAKCAIHCYSPSMRASVTEVMKYAGPRMITKHLILTLLHGI